MRLGTALAVWCAGATATARPFASEAVGTFGTVVLSAQPTNATQCLPLGVDPPLRCNYVRQNDVCDIQEGFVSYVRFHFCAAPDNTTVSTVLLVLLLTFFFFALGNTAEEYFSPTMAMLSDHLKLPPNIAGVTFLALGNGAPDIFSAFAAMTGSHAELGLAAVLGAGVFVPVMVVGLVSFVAPGAQITRRPFLRDGFVLLTGATMVFSYSMTGTIHMWQAIGLLMLYVVYVSIVVVGRKVHLMLKRRSQVQKSSSQSHFADNLESQMAGASPLALSYARFEDEDYVRFDDGDEEEKVEAIELKPRVDADNIVEDHGALFGDESQSQLTPVLPPEDANIPSVKNSLSWILRRALWLVALPLNVCCTLTIPLVDQEHWDWRLACGYPILSPLWLLLVTGNIASGFRVGSWSIPFSALLVPVFAGVAFFVHHSIRNDRDRPRFIVPFLLLAFLTGTSWIYFIANELVTLLQTMGVVFRIRNELLGLTVLAWGNSVGDLVSNVSVARLGLPQMSVGASMGGPILSLCVGVGSAMTYNTVKKGDPFDMPRNASIFLCSIAMIVAICSHLLVIPLNSFRLPRGYAFVCFTFYAVFMMVTLLTYFDVISISFL